MTNISINCTQLMGYIVDIPRVRRTQDGRVTVKLTISTLSISPDEETGRIDWHKVVICNQRLAKFAEQHLYKGSHVFIEGKLQTRQWQSKEGQVRRLTEVVLNGYDGKLFLVGDESGDHEEPPEDGGDGAIDGYQRFAEMDEESFLMADPFIATT